MSAFAAETRYPVRLGTAEEFARVGGFFKEAAFDERTVCTALGMEGMGDLGKVQWDTTPLDALTVPLRWCLQVFVRGLPVSAAESRKVCGEALWAALLALGLLRLAKQDPAKVVCPVWVYPADGFVVISDRHDDPDGETYSAPEDVVFPAIYGGTLRFLRLLPPAKGGDVLDLCGGSGIGALRFSRSARGAVTADVTERSAFFAEFNARLNQAPVTSVCGDLYEPVAGRQFDVISAHPPFVPATGANMVYRDGGDTGEEVTRRTVEGLRAHLRPGGTCVILCVARDTEEGPFEQRARRWLGSAGGEFDVVFGLEKVLSVEEVVESIRKRNQAFGEQQARELLGRLRSLGTRQFVYGALFLRRELEVVLDEPLRVRLTAAGSAEDFERLLAWRHHRRTPGFAEWLVQSRPRLAPQLQLTARHVVQEGQLVPAEFVFSIEEGFQYALRPDAWVVPLLARLEGKRTLGEVFESARAAEELPEGFTLDAFAGLVQTMLEGGLLQVELPG